MNMRYEVPDYLSIPVSKHVSIAVLDELIEELFGFHFIVPIAEFDNVLKVKPSFNILSWPLPSSTKTQKMSETPKPLTWSSPSWKKLSKAEIEIKPELSAVLKLEVARAFPSERKQVQEVAECLEEILNSVEVGLWYLP